MPLPTKGDIRISGETRITSTLRLTGNAKIVGDGWFNNVQSKPFADAIYVPPGITLDAQGYIFRNREWKGADGKWTCTRSITVDGALVFNGSQIVEGYGLEVLTGSVLWIGGGGSGIQRYLAKFGDADNNPNIVAKRGHMELLTCPGSTTEAVVRAQGVDRLIVKNCILLQKDAAGRHEKGSLALRLLRGCTIEGGEYDTMELGWRTPESVGAKDEKFGGTRPGFIFVAGATVNGSARVNGNISVAIQNGRCAGMDRRGFGEKKAIIEQSHKAYRAEAVQVGYQIPAGWKMGDGVDSDPNRLRTIWANANAN